MRFSILLLSCFLCVFLYAQTNVSGNISGTWTTANSPYLVTNNIGVPAGQTLVIQPGVQVVFQGFYRFGVSGQLVADGTVAQPITFSYFDTTGWYNDQQMAGGWRGIYFAPFASVNDSSRLEHCVVKDVKHGLNGNANGYAALYIYGRGLTVRNCEFTHNQSKANASEGKIIVSAPSTGQTLTLEACYIHHNKVRVAVLFNTGKALVQENEFANNIGGSTIWALGGGLQFYYNDVHDNQSIYDMTALRVDGGYNTIKNNKIHHNEADREAAIFCTMGKTTIESNLICNNYTLNGNCGATDGGGGIHISHNNSGVWDSTEYLIRNNVIANNHCAFNGGGIYVYDCKAKILNNHIVNNTAQMGGGAIYSIGSQTRLNIRNNLIHGNDYAQFHSTYVMQFSGSDSIKLDYNWMDNAFYQTVIMNPAVGYLGDTSHNVDGTDPFLFNPTLVAGLAEDALFKDFKLTAQSIELINMGVISNAYPAAFDYLGNNRLVGNIDIGAFEASFGSLSEGKLSFGIYPNPVQDILNVKGFDGQGYEIVNIQGQKLLEGFLSKDGISVKDLPAGMYLIQIIGNFNEQILSTKFFKP
ncbi:MAG: T9SS C-terminal target domain-containing protein [Flavobacteriia bacterium]|nr:T9SS C-terminal target domain-containing protein [Flavobacteriia bacterium]